MKPIAKVDCNINGIFYSTGDEIEVENTRQLVKLNERGFIKPMSAKEIQDYFKKPEINRIFRKEEE